MGTTVVSILLSQNRGQTFIAHVGDSRAYRIRGGAIELMTRDHSLVNDYLMVMPDMTPEQVAELPKNVITRALGMQDSVAVDLLPDAPQPGDVYVLCSDGLNGMIEDATINDIATRAGDDMEQLVAELVREANANGGDDNVTVVAVLITA